MKGLSYLCQLTPTSSSPSPGQLEELEVLLKEDIQDEVGSWGGRILLHQVWGWSHREMAFLWESNDIA